MTQATIDRLFEEGEDEHGQPFVSTSKGEKIPFMYTSDPKWKIEAYRLMRDYCPNVGPCENCGGPKMNGYKCNRCDNVQ